MFFSRLLRIVCKMMCEIDRYDDSSFKRSSIRPIEDDYGPVLTIFPLGNILTSDQIWEKKKLTYTGLDWIGFEGIDAFYTLKKIGSRYVFTTFLGVRRAPLF